MRSCYSYVRFSSAEQAAGDSLRRQLELSRAYAEKHGFALDESLRPDRGVSAFKGKNRTEGSLGAFLEAVKSGKVPRGSALLVESLDRLSREQVEESMFMLLDIVRAGIEVHTLSDGQIYKRGSMKPEQIMLSVFVLSRSNEESQRKSERVGAAWGAKKRNAVDLKAITATSPAWLKAELGKPIVPIPERVKVVKEIFRLAAAGMGRGLIARQLNEKKVPTFGTSEAWQHSYVRKVLGSRAVLGEYQPYREQNGVREPDGPVIQGFYPVIITLTEWQAAHVNSRSMPGRIGRRVGSLFTGLIFDADLKRPMHYDDKGRGNSYLTSDSARLGVKPNHIRYDRFEASFLKFLAELNWRSVLNLKDSEELGAARERAARLKADIERVDGEIQNLTAGLASMGVSPAITAALASKEKDRARMVSDMKAASDNLEECERRNAALLSVDVAYAKLAEASDIETRSKLRAEIRRRVERIDLHFNISKLKLRWNGPAINPTCVAMVYFVTGSVRILMFNKAGDFYGLAEPKI